MIEKIIESLKSKGLTQEALATAAGLSANRISKWKDGQGEPTARQIYRIAKVCGVPVDYLLDDEMDAPIIASGLSDDERTLLTVYRSLRGPDLTIEDAIRRISRERQPPRPVTQEELNRRQSG